MILCGFEKDKIHENLRDNAFSNKTGRKKYGTYDIIYKAIWQFKIDLMREEIFFINLTLKLFTKNFVLDSRHSLTRAYYFHILHSRKNYAISFLYATFYCLQSIHFENFINNFE